MESLVRRAFELNSASGVIRELLDLMQKDDYAARDLTCCVEKDPALTVRVLATANSARYGADRRIASVEQAVAILGRRKLRTIVLTFSVIESLSRGLDAKLYGDYWKRSLRNRYLLICSGELAQMMSSNQLAELFFVESRTVSLTCRTLTPCGV